MCVEGVVPPYLPMGQERRQGIELAQATWEGGYGYKMGDSRRKNVPMEPGAEKEA